MLNKSIALGVLVCDNCNELLIYSIGNGIPRICPKCNVPSDKTMSIEEINLINRENERHHQTNQQFMNQHGNSQGIRFNFRRG